jgi:hypothetical protein
MRTWMITLIGLGGAVILDIGVVRPVLSPTGPVLVAAAIAIYAGLVSTLTTAFFLIALRRIRFRLARTAPTRDQWIVLFAESGLVHPT